MLWFYCALKCDYSLWEKHQRMAVKVTASSNSYSTRTKLSDLRISRPALEVTRESSHFSPQVTIKISEKSLSRSIIVHRISIQSFLYLSPSFINSIQPPRWPAARPPSPFWSNFLKNAIAHGPALPFALSAPALQCPPAHQWTCLSTMYTSVANELAFVGGRKPLREPPKTKFGVSPAPVNPDIPPSTSLSHTRTPLTSGVSYHQPLGVELCAGLGCSRGNRCIWMYTTGGRRVRFFSFNTVFSWFYFF